MDRIILDKTAADFDVSRFAYVLMSRGLLTPRDIDYICGREALESWKDYNTAYKLGLIVDRPRGVQ